MGGVPGEVLWAIALGPLLWWVGAVGFDAVHWVLHRMLRSRHGWLRALAWPHQVHHEWIDRKLVTHFDRQRANVWCHIVPEYLTQLVYTAGLAWLLPAAFAVVVGLLQTAVFLGMLRLRGLDVNHRPAARIDAHPPGWKTPPAYHALHHAWPDACFSSYAKWIDRLVGSGTPIAGRRFHWEGGSGGFGAVLCQAVEGAGGLAAAASGGDADVQVWLDPDAALAPRVEALIDATRDRQLPPEVWVLRRRADDGQARHYRDDPRVCLRTLHLPEAPACDDEARRAARRALFWLRRDAHFVGLGGSGLYDLVRFLRAPARAPEGVVVRSRLSIVRG
jgi:hypothetical protein